MNGKIGNDRNDGRLPYNKSLIVCVCSIDTSRFTKHTEIQWKQHDCQQIDVKQRKQ